MELLWKIYWAFFRIGALTFGGGYAMMPMLQKETVERYDWATQEELLNYFSLSQCLPGIIAVNVSTFVGTKIKGLTGAIAAGLGVVTPSLIIIIIVAYILGFASDLSVMNHAFAGIRIAVTALILQSVIGLSKSSLKTKFAVAVCVGAAILSTFDKISPILIVLAAAILGILAGVINSRNNKEGDVK